MNRSCEKSHDGRKDKRVAGNGDPFGDLRLSQSSPRTICLGFNVPPARTAKSDLYGANSTDNQPSGRYSEGLDKNGPARVLRPRDLVYVWIQICPLLVSGSRRTDVTTIHLCGSTLNARRYTKLRSVCMVDAYGDQFVCAAA